MNIVKDFRTSRKMTQDAFAKWIGVTLRTVQRWEATGSAPIPVLKLLAER